MRGDADALNWEQLRARVDRNHRNYRLRLWMTPLFLLQLPLAFLLARGDLPPWELFLIVAPANVVIYAAHVWLVSRSSRTLFKSARSSTDLLLGYERELRGQRLRARVFAIVNTVLAAACMYPLFFAEEPRLRLYAFGCSLIFGAWAAYDLSRRLPRLDLALAEVRP